jgi:transcriptional regulator with XRE-family HTH domain
MAQVWVSTHAKVKGYNPQAPDRKKWDKAHMSLVERIQRRLRATGLRPRRASELAGLNPTYLRDILDGRTRNPKTEQLTKLAAVLKTTSEWLLEGRGEEEPSAEQREYARIEAMVKKIPREDLANAERALKGFVREEPPAAFEEQPAKRRPAKKRRPRG